MKRIIAILLTLLLSVAFLPALAEEDAALEGALPANTPLTEDLDGDGVSEELSWTMVSDGSDDVLTLSIDWEEGDTLSYKSDIVNMPVVCVQDLDGDGIFEILISGDVMSDDYYTRCLHLREGALVELLFPDSSRGENTKGYFKEGYGLIAAIEGDALTLSGSQDMLGTWFATRKVSLTPLYRFEFADDGFWVRNVDFDDPEVWDYAALTTKVELPYTAEDGTDGVLAPGTRLIVTATDKDTVARFTAEDGTTGTLAVDQDYDRGWGNTVNGVPEDDCFELIPYAD